MLIAVIGHRWMLFFAWHPGSPRLQNDIHFRRSCDWEGGELRTIEIPWDTWTSLNQFEAVWSRSLLKLKLWLSPWPSISWGVCLWKSKRFTEATAVWRPKGKLLADHYEVGGKGCSDYTVVSTSPVLKNTQRPKLLELIDVRQKYAKSKRLLNTLEVQTCQWLFHFWQIFLPSWFKTTFGKFVKGTW